MAPWHETLHPPWAPSSRILQLSRGVPIVLKIAQVHNAGGPQTTALQLHRFHFAANLSSFLTNFCQPLEPKVRFGWFEAKNPVVPAWSTITSTSAVVATCKRTRLETCRFRVRSPPGIPSGFPSGVRRLKQCHTQYRQRK